MIPRPDTSAGGSRSARSCRWEKRASAASVWTNGFAAHRQKPDPASANPNKWLLKQLEVIFLSVPTLNA